MSRSPMGIAFVVLFAATPVLSAGDCCLGRFCKSRSCGENSCCEEECHRRKGIGLTIPSLRISLDCGCNTGCGHGCWRCKKDCCFWKPAEPPRGPVVFSVPAVTVPQQALPIQPQLAPLVVQPQAARTCPPCPPAELSASDKLLLEILLRQSQSGTAQGAAQTREASAASAHSQATVDPATEARLTELENRLDRILQLLEE